MQKVEGSSPFIRFARRPAIAGLLRFFGLDGEHVGPRGLDLSVQHG